ncbi:MAG: O-antigen ligase family protein [Phycisphaerales bacterium]|nr:O-antigen ligase family protein [Phycisphaerales bacterium]
MALIGNCLLTSPRAFSAQHQDDTSLLRVIISLSALTSPSAQEPAFPTARGIEIRNLIFYGGAAMLALVAGLWLIGSGRKHRLSTDDLFDLRERASGPYFWWALLLLVSVITSVFSHAPDVSKGQVVIRFMQFAWWCPLAALLAPRHVRVLMIVLLIGVASMAAIGIWHYTIRLAPEWLSAPFSATLPRLSYPIGNETWFGACLLPAVFIISGLAQERWATSFRGASRRRPWLSVAGLLVVLLLVLAALLLTQARSAGWFGLAAGIFAFIVFLFPSRQIRLVIVLIGLLAAIGGTKKVQQLRTTGVMGQRAHSIRSRLDYEWPYALQMFYQKPVGGHGEGGYAMLAGQIARSDQLEDPSVIAIEERWPAHAHNEWLQLLADVGVAGMLGFLVAIGLTLYWAMRYCDRLKKDPSGKGRRWLAISLAAALIAMAVEEGSNMALREPGFPPIFLTVWAALWALVGKERRVLKTEEAASSDGRVMQLSGAAVTLVALMLGYLAIQDWRAARARFDGVAQTKGDRSKEAAKAIDFAESYTLDPMQKLLTRLDSVDARIVGLERMLHKSDTVPTDADLKIAQDALIKLNQLNQAAPRFLQVSKMAWRLSSFLADAHRRRGDLQNANGYDEQRLLALRQYREDEPFNLGIVEVLCQDPRMVAARARLWQRSRDASVVHRHLRERLQWLQSLLRRREIDDPFVRIVQNYRQIRGSKGLMDGLVDVAKRDLELPVAKWGNPLSPETLRIEALGKWLEGRPEEAMLLAKQSIAMYEKAGPRLFVAHAAAIREAVRYQFFADPMSETDAMLTELARANEILTGVRDEDGTRPLKGALGQLRLWILLAADRPESDAQLETLFAADDSPESKLLARAYTKLSGHFTLSPKHGDQAIRWARRAIELWPEMSDAHLMLMGSLLQRGQDLQALAEANRVIELIPEKETAFAKLQLAEAQWPNSGLWAELRRNHPDYPAQTPGIAPTTTTQSADEDESKGDGTDTNPEVGTNDAD